MALLLAASAEGLKIEWAIASELSSHPEKWASQGRVEGSVQCLAGRRWLCWLLQLGEPRASVRSGACDAVEGTEPASSQPQQNEQQATEWKAPRVTECGVLRQLSSSVFLWLAQARSHAAPSVTCREDQFCSWQTHITAAYFGNEKAKGLLDDLP